MIIGAVWESVAALVLFFVAISMLGNFSSNIEIGVAGGIFLIVTVFGTVFFLAYGVLLVLFREKLTMELMGDLRRYMDKNSDKRKKY